MLKTVVIALMLVGAWSSLTSSLTQGWRTWTYEDWRRERAVGQAWVAQTIGVRDAQGRDHAWPPPPLSCGPDPCRVHIVDFFYTGCDSICQVLGAEFKRMQQALATLQSDADDSNAQARLAQQVRLWSISMDLQHDDPAALQRYAQRHQAQPDYWRLVTPHSVAEERALRHSLGVVAVPDGLGGYVHNASLHVVDTKGQVLGIYEHAQWRRALALALNVAVQTP